MARWEARISMYRNGRRVEIADAQGDDPEEALYNAENDLSLWASSHPNTEKRRNGDD